MVAVAFDVVVEDVPIVWLVVLEVVRAVCGVSSVCIAIGRSIVY